MTGDFHEVVKKISGYNVVPISTEHLILDVLSDGLDALVSKAKYTVYRYGRINEVGKELEREVSDIVNKSMGFVIIPHSQRVGYPDMRVNAKEGLPTFIEVKVTTVTEGELDTQRRFYMSSGNKIQDNGHHLLVLLYVKAEGDGFKLKAWRINDLYDLQVSFKGEYNASSKDFARLKVLRHS